MSDKEIERKYLVGPDALDFLQKHPSREIKQAYIALTEDREVRLRSVDDRQYFLTVKSAGGLSRNEYEIELTADQARKMLPLMGENCICKTRYLVPHNDLVIEVDVYSEKLKGLLTAEVEFPDEETSERFSPPDWLGKEVTEDRRFKNKNLVGKNFGDLET